MKLNFDSALRVLLVAVAVVVAAPVAFAQVAEPEEGKALQPDEEWVKLTPEEYIYRWRATAIDNMEVYGIPASITMGQAILESGFGNGYLARVANNHFCIKCKSSWTGATVIHADDRPDDCFRAYDTAEDSFADHAEFLSSGSRYEFLFAYDIDDYKSWAKGLKQAGYATAHDYADRLIGVIERYHLYLLDRKDGIALYDDYVAQSLNLNPAALASDTATSEGAQEVAAVAMEEDVERNPATAYADKGIDPNNFRVSISSHHGYNVYRTNRAHYIITKSGDSFERIGELFAVSPATLRKFNDIKDDKAQPNEGDVLYIERKAARWGGAELMHTVAEGETLYFIAQLYGIRLAQLSKLNKMRANAKLVAGQTIRIR